MSTRHQNQPFAREEALFARALGLSPSELCAYLDHACHGDNRLHDRIEALLEAHAQAGDFLTIPHTVPSAEPNP